MITELDPRTALVLIDLQKGIVAMPTAHPIAEIVNRSADLLTAFHDKDLPVVIINVNPFLVRRPQPRVEQSSMPKEEQARKQAKEMMEQNGFFDIISELKTGPDDIFITKEGWNAFYNTELDKKLKSLGITGIVLAGVATSIGVEGTARDASQRGYNITFAKDAMTDMKISAHENSLNIIFPRIGEVDDTAAIIKKLKETV